MADPAPVLDASARAALARLADIAVPDPVPWLPRTWGWAALGIAALAVAVWLLVRARRRRRANRYRVEALAELARLEARLDDSAQRAAALAALPALLKRAALAAWPRSDVAALSGETWVRFLLTHAGRARLSDAAVRLLDDAEYRSSAALAAVTSADAHAIARSARAWIEEHRVSA